MSSRRYLSKYRVMKFMKRLFISKKLRRTVHLFQLVAVQGTTGILKVNSSNPLSNICKKCFEITRLCHIVEGGTPVLLKDEMSFFCRSEGVILPCQLSSTVYIYCHTLQCIRAAKLAFSIMLVSRAVAQPSMCTKMFLVYYDSIIL